jgi:transposase-like protein
VGGLGSGRRRRRLGVDECRALELGELCDQGRWLTQPRGEVLWRARHGGETLARLVYVISGQEDALEDLLLTYRYGRGGAELSVGHEVELERSSGRRLYAYCPACGRRVRTLYAPRGAERFACRSCYRLVYRRSRADETLAYASEAAGPAMRQLQALPRRTRRRARRRYVAAPPAALARELAAQPPLGEAEARLWCLRLRAAGLSYRQIAALLEFSKSSVARYCAAGRSGIDTMALVRERVEQVSAGPAPPQDDDLRGLDAYLRAMHRHALRLGLYHHPLSETEERVVIPDDSGSEK